LNASKNLARRSLSTCVRDGVPRLDHTNAFGGQAVPVASDHKSGKSGFRRPMPFYCDSHRCGGLACADYKGAAARRPRKVCGNYLQRVGRRNCCAVAVEQ
jgi:hypothetical protein